jgi:glyoxylase-like metal-dependent hydrolase (beta-lactamase superfamily II)
MNRTKIEAAPGITCFREPLGIRFVSFYALDDADGVVLFDAAVPGVVTAWLDEGELDGAVTRIFISHSDADHFGDVAALRARFPAVQVFCHGLDRQWIEDHDLIVKERYDHARPEHDFGYDQDTLAVLRNMCGPSFEVTDIVEGGDTFTIGDRTWEVLHLPGHSPGHISLWSEGDGILLLGDAVLGFGPPDFEGKPSMPSTHQYIASYLSTIDRLEQLPVQLALSAHWPFMDGAQFKQLLGDSRERVSRDHALILEACSESPRSYAELVGLLSDAFRTWPEAEDTSYMFALSGSLDYLQDQGLLRKVGGHYVA